MIYSDITANLVLGCIMKDPTLCVNDKYNLTQKDFCIQEHRIIWWVIANLSQHGIKKANLIDIENFLSKDEARFNLYKNIDGGGREYLKTIYKLADLNNFDAYYNKLKIFSCLRDYQSIGNNISKFWDVDISDEKNLSNLEGYTSEDIVRYFELRQSDIKIKYDSNMDYTEMICGDGFDELLDELQEEPLVGAGICSPMLNELYRGWCKTHLILRGAPSSFGKTLFGLADSLNVSSLKIWSDEANDFIDNPYYQGMGAYIHTEQNSKKDIQTRACSILAQIPYGTLRNGEYTKEEKIKLSKAGKILKESKFKILYYPNFTMTGTREVVKRLSLQMYEYITMDYIWNNSWIIADIKKTTGISNISEPNALMQYANALKGIAEEFNVAMATMMQLNGKEKDAELVDDGCLYASRAVKTKLDNGSIMKIPTTKELCAIKPFIEKWNKDNGIQSMVYPNAVSHCFKTRYGGHGENIKVFHLVDKSIGKITDMFATNWDNSPLIDLKTRRPYELPKLYIETKK